MQWEQFPEMPDSAHISGIPSELEAVFSIVCARRDAELLKQEVKERCVNGPAPTAHLGPRRIQFPDDTTHRKRHSVKIKGQALFQGVRNSEQRVQRKNLL